MMKKSGDFNVMLSSKGVKVFLNGVPIGTTANIPVEFRTQSAVECCHCPQDFRHIAAVRVQRFAIDRVNNPIERGKYRRQIGDAGQNRAEKGISLNPCLVQFLQSGDALFDRRTARLEQLPRFFVRQRNGEANGCTGDTFQQIHVAQHKVGFRENGRSELAFRVVGDLLQNGTSQLILGFERLIYSKRRQNGTFS